MSSSFSDFNDIWFDTDGVFAKNQTVWLWAFIDYNVEFYNGSDWEGAYYKDKFLEKEVPIYTPLYFDETIQVTDIAYKGNGNYRIKILGYADEDSDETGWHSFSVADNTAPSIPANAAKSWSSDHPHLTWDANTEIDLQYYEVWKKRNSGSWSLKTTTTNTYYTDTSEDKWSSGTKEYVYYKMRAVDLTNNESSYTSTFTFAVNEWQQKVIAINLSQEAKLSEYILTANYPNPFNPLTSIDFALPEQSNISLKVYNIAGKEIATLAEGSKEEGFYTSSFNGSSLSSGVYIYRFTAKGLETGKSFSEVKRMILVK